MVDVRSIQHGNPVILCWSGPVPECVPWYGRVVSVALDAGRVMIDALAGRCTWRWRVPVDRLIRGGDRELRFHLRPDDRPEVLEGRKASVRAFKRRMCRL